jgi:hypothetical protein
MTDNVIQYYHNLMVNDWLYTFSYSLGGETDEIVYVAKKKERVNDSTSIKRTVNRF